MKPPQLKHTHGIIRRRDFADYIRELSRHLGIRLGSSDFISVRDTGHGLHIRRRRAPLPTLITLELEYEYRWAEVFACASFEEDGVAYSHSEVVEHYENGDITYTTTQPDPGPHLFTADDPLHECESTVATDDEDPEFDYGALESTDDPTYSGAVDVDALLTSARAAVVSDGSPYIEDDWSWMSDVDPPTGVSGTLGRWTKPSLLTSRKVESYRYRWVVTGDYDLELAWDQGGTGHTETVAPGTPGSWHTDTVPATVSVNDLIENVVITVP